MTNTRVPIPTTNLKERIAALEQRNSTIGGPTSRSVSPAPGAAASSTSTIQPAGAFRDKIAKFERKGGVPVPRGRFGLGAPPTSQGPSKQGQLYGNRIPAPARVVSTGSAYTLSRAASPTGDGPAGDRRSFSMSSVAGSEFGDDIDYTPVASPTFTFPPDSPDSLFSVPYSPEVSPQPFGEAAATFNKPIVVRGTSFQKALEIARNAETAKAEGRESWAPVVTSDSLDEQNGDLVDTSQVEERESPVLSSTDDEVNVKTTAVPIVTTMPEDTTPVTVDNSTTQKMQTVVNKPTEPEHLRTPAATLSSDIIETSSHTKEVAETLVVRDSVLSESSPVQVKPVSLELSSTMLPSPEDRPVSIHYSPTEDIISTPVAATPVSPEPSPTCEPQPQVAYSPPKFVEVAPLNIRKVSTPPRRPSTEPVHEIIPSILPSLETAIPPPEVTVAPPVIIVNEVANGVEELTSDTGSQSSTPVTATTPVNNSIAEKQEVVPRISIKLPPPEITLEGEEPVVKEKEVQVLLSSTNSDDFNSRKAALTLDSSIIDNDDSIISPPLFTHASVQSLTTVLTNYYTGGLVSGDGEKTFRPTTPPPLPSVTPLSPDAILAYDAPESPEAPVVPPARPRVKALDPQSFLSPPATASFSVAGSSAGSSMGSLSSLGSRPMSMIETSPTHITRALRMTPATSRGVPVYLPPNSARPRKSDFVYFPPTPDAEATQFSLEPTEEEVRRRRDSEPDLAVTLDKQMPTFTAVVHDKIRETPASSTQSRSKHYVIPSTPQVKRVQRGTLPEPPLSPGQGELAALLQEAMLLEDTLSKGELPAENIDPMETERREQERLEAIAIVEAEAKAKKEAEEAEAHRQRIAYATAQLQAKRDEPTSGKLKHTFLIPLSKARSVHHRKENSSTSRSGSSNDVTIQPPKSAGLPVPPRHVRAETLDVVSSSQPLRSIAPPKTPEEANAAKPAELPSKSPKSTSRFASLRRLGSMARPNTVHGQSARHSNSTSSEISSEDSQPVLTPPENHLEFRLNGASVSEFGHVSNGSTSSFPSLSSKKSTSSIGRATSFAEKMWSRSRTKSGASSLSGTSEATADTSPKLPSLAPSAAFELPSISLNLAPLSEVDESRVVQPPRRSTSLKRSVNLPSIPTEPVPPLPQITSSAFHVQVPSTDVSDTSNDSTFLLPSSDSTRPSSWVSVSSAGSLPSPFFDKALFDAFPSVPENVPPMERSLPIRRDNTITKSGVNAGPSFDSALLSSAIHLASSQKSTVPTTTDSQTPLPRRSGESAR